MTDPFASPTATPGVPCPSCQRSVPQAQLQMSESGTLVCGYCAAAPQMAAAESDNASRRKSMFIGALSSVGIGALSFCVEARGIFFLLPLVAIGSAVMILISCVRDPDAKRDLGWRYAPTLILSAIGIFIALGALAVQIFVRMA